MRTFFPIIMIVLFSCASQGIPSGGPVDVEGPIIISFNVSYKEDNTIYPNKPIVIIFNEFIEPLSAMKAITINGGSNFNIKIRNNKIIISPKNIWESIIELNISRTITDYRGNMMISPVTQIFQSEAGRIFNGKINGQLANILEDKIYEVGLYSVNNNENIFIKKTEADIDGNFNFFNVSNGNFRLCAIEGKLNDFNNDYRLLRYGIEPKPILLNSEIDSIYSQIMIDNPLPRHKIIGAELISHNHALLTLSDQSEKIIYVESNKNSVKYNTGDTISISNLHYNRFEEYMMPEFNFVANIKIDTIAPSVESYHIENNIMHITFSEPFKLLKKSVFLDQNKKALQYKVLDLVKLEVVLNNIDDDNIYIDYGSISDLNKNIIDSLTVLSIPKLDSVNAKKGSLIGKINNYNGSEKIVVRLSDINSDNKYHIVADSNMKFKFDNIIPGNYMLDSYELKNNNPSIYYSGIWEPFSKPAQFTLYPNIIDIRAHWIVEGIEIDYN